MAGTAAPVTGPTILSFVAGNRIEIWSACIDVFDVRICLAVEYDNANNTVFGVASVAGHKIEFPIVKNEEFEFPFGPVKLKIAASDFVGGPPICFTINARGCVSVLGFERCIDLFRQQFCLPNPGTLAPLSGGPITLEYLRDMSSLHRAARISTPSSADTRR